MLILTSRCKHESRQVGTRSYLGATGSPRQTIRISEVAEKVNETRNHYLRSTFATDAALMSIRPRILSNGRSFCSSVRESSASNSFSSAPKEASSTSSVFFGRLDYRVRPSPQRLSLISIRIDLDIESDLLNVVVGGRAIPRKTAACASSW